MKKKWDEIKSEQTRDRMRLFVVMTVVLMVSVWMSLPVFGQEADEAPSGLSGAEVLARVDGALTVADDFTATIELTTTSRSGEEESRTMTVWQKGAGQRMVKLTAPARLRGVGLLAQSEGQLYIYLPSFQRVRRVAGQQRGEPFMGSHFTQDDLTRTGYGERFRAELEGEEEGAYRLSLWPLAPEDEPYHRLVLEVRKEDFQVRMIEVYESGDEGPTRRLVVHRFEEIQGQVLAMEIEAQELRRGGRSVAVFGAVEVNAGLSDAIFTQRYLQR